MVSVIEGAVSIEGDIIALRFVDTRLECVYKKSDSPSDVMSIVSACQV